MYPEAGRSDPPSPSELISLKSQTAAPLDPLLVCRAREMSPLRALRRPPQPPPRKNWRFESFHPSSELSGCRGDPLLPVRAMNYPLK